MNTPSLKASEISRKWYIVDASEARLGRLSSEIAKYLSGKHKPTFTPNIDNGDYVVVVNAAKLKVSGKKLDNKKYYRHSGYRGSIKEVSLRQRLDKDPTKVIEDSVKGMLPKNKLHDGRMKRLKVYPGEEHGNEAQKPTKLNLNKDK